MDIYDFLANVQDKLDPEIITCATDIGGAYVVSVCCDDGYPPLHMPYLVSRSGKIRDFDMRVPKNVKLVEQGRVIYTDDTMLRKPPKRKGPKTSSDSAKSRHDGWDDEAEDGDEGSGNWGHEGRPGKVGGSKDGGGVQNRLGTKEKGYTSEAKEKKKAKQAAASSATKTTAAPKKPVRPKAADFKDADGYVDYEALDVARAEYKAKLAAWEGEIGEIISAQVPEHSMTIEEMESWCEKSGASIYGSLEGMDGRLLTAYTERFEQLAADFPEGLSQTMTDGATGEKIVFDNFDISYDPSGVGWLAEASTGMKFGGWARDAEEMARASLEQQGDGYNVNTGTALTSLFDHEYGHRVYDGLKWDGVKSYKDREAMQQDLIQNVYGKSGMSEYATTNDDELFAEGFAAYYGGLNTEFAKATGEFIERWRTK